MVDAIGRAEVRPGGGGGGWATERGRSNAVGSGVLSVVEREGRGEIVRLENSLVRKVRKQACLFVLFVPVRVPEP